MIFFFTQYVLLNLIYLHGDFEKIDFLGTDPLKGIGPEKKKLAQFLTKWANYTFRRCNLKNKKLYPIGPPIYLPSFYFFLAKKGKNRGEFGLKLRSLWWIIGLKGIPNF